MTDQTQTDEFDEHVKEYQEAELPDNQPDSAAQRSAARSRRKPAEAGGSRRKPTVEQGAEPVANETDEADQQGAEEGEQGADEPQKETQETVPLGTFLEQKRAAKQSQQQVGELADQIKALKEQIEALSPGEQPPSQEDDPFAYLDYKLTKIDRHFDEQTKQQQESAQDQQQQNAQAQLQNMEQRFAQQNADYYDAVEFLRESRLKEYDEMGYDEDDAAKVFNDEAAFLAQGAIRAGKNPAQVAYNLAKQRGFAPKNGNQSEGQDNPQAESLKQTAKRLSNSQTLSNKGGRAAKDELDVPDINQLDDDEFDKLFLGKEGDKRLKNLMQ